MVFQTKLNIFLIIIIVSLCFCLIIPNFSKYNFINKEIIKEEVSDDDIVAPPESILQVNKYINIVIPKLVGHGYLKGFLQTPGRNVIMYLHKKGEHYTDYVLRGATWQSGLVQEMNNCIKENPGVQLLDLGCNLGTFTLNAAALGCKVVAVDADPKNAARLSQSLADNGFQGIVLNNAMNDVRGRLISYKTKHNFIAYKITQENNIKNGVEAIFIDDLVLLFDKDREIIIKIDIETKEIDALKKASLFFEQRNVIFVIMEWEHIKKMKEISYVMNFFRQRNFKAYVSYKENGSLNYGEYMNWPNDIYWKKVI